MSTRARPAYSESLDAALRLTAAAHHEDTRKGTGIPYAMHPFHVGLLLDRHGWSDSVVIAGFLHDVLEDPKYGQQVVQDRIRAVVTELQSAPPDEGGFFEAVKAYIAVTFGVRVLRLIEHVSEAKIDGQGQKRPWQVRKDEQLAGLARASRAGAALKAADCLHNLIALTRDVETHGLTTLERFNAGPPELLWYYGQVAERCTVRLGKDDPLARELRGALRSFARALQNAGLGHRA